MVKKNLVIVESPAKAKTLEKFLGKDYSVKACAGHVRDLPAKRLGVDVKKDFEPTYVVPEAKRKIVKDLKEAAKTAKMILLAPDPDREGEAIAWQLEQILKDGHKIKRIEFHEITKQAVLAAVSHPRAIDMNRVNAQQARRILDRLVGYKISPILWKKIRKGLSAGRVQSVAVRLICEREDAIEAFVPVEYWSITAELSQKTSADIFLAKLIQKNAKELKVGKEKEAQAVLSDLAGAKFTVSKVSEKKRSKYPLPPFITSTLQQDAVHKLGYSAQKTMVIAQQLYEGVSLKGKDRVGLITYMRTDSVRIANEAQAEARKFISQKFNKKYLPDQAIQYKARKQAQDAHEAIRPTSVFHAPEEIKDSLTPEQFKLYELIWKRFVACQMNPAEFLQTSADITAGEYLFRANGSVLKFDGYQKLYIEAADEEEERSRLPKLSEGEALNLKQLLPKQHFTESLPRYTEASIVKELELRGIGRPSTYAPIISTVVAREYVRKEGRTLFPTELGRTINTQLVKHFPAILDFEFTAKMEDDLDEIVTGKVKWLKMLKDFYGPFEESIKKADINMEKIKKEELLEEKCPECGKKLMIRDGRYGQFVACSGFPECKYTKPIVPTAEEAKESGEVCEKCGKPMILKQSRFGKFWACSGYPACKTIKSINKKTGVKCPKEGCGGELVERRSKKGRVFYGCSNYPKCDFAVWNRPTAEKCDKCGSVMVEKSQKGQINKVCSNPECEYNKKQ